MQFRELQKGEVMRIDKVCAYCKKPFVAYSDARRTCSTSCRKEYERAQIQARFWVKVQKTDGCWLWTGRLDSHGYGLFRAPGIRIRAHRFAYQALVSFIPEGLHIDHLCRNRQCVNPAHLEPVTCKENLLRGEGPTGKKSRQTHCINGHILDAENTYVRPNGTRLCRTCAKERARMYRSKV